MNWITYIIWITYIRIGDFFKKIRKLPEKIQRELVFKKDYNDFRSTSLTKNSRFIPRWNEIYPRLNDKTSTTSFDTHYIYHPAWAARIVKQINPEFHVDISSTLAFSSMLSAFIPVHFYDYRPANVTLSNLTSARADLLSLPFPDNSIKSLSCMHTVEHIGLGRYGDPIDPDGDLKASKELIRVLAMNGNLLFVVPVGKSKIAFNAHRIYSYAQVTDMFSELTLKQFSLIPDNALTHGVIENASVQEVNSQNYGCGCFWFVKK